MPETTLPVEHLFRMSIQTALRAIIANGPRGTRAVVDCPEGSFEGERLRGTLHSPGGDWATVAPDGTVHVDARVLLKTEDGADIFMTYLGIGTPGGAELRTAPQFQTSDERYTWLNGVQAIGVGGNEGGVVSYEVYRVL